MQISLKHQNNKRYGVGICLANKIIPTFNIHCITEGLLRTKILFFQHLRTINYANIKEKKFEFPWFNVLSASVWYFIDILDICISYKSIFVSV